MTQAIDDLRRDIEAASAFLRQQAKFDPQFGLILGTGLGGLGEQIEAKATVPFDQIPGFVKSTATSHAGNLILGVLGGQRVMAMQGRVHYYEGYTMAQVTFPVRVMRAMGCHSLVMSSAVGGMNPQMAPGDIVVVTDHINFMGDNPLIGPNDDELGPRFPDMSQPYDREYVGRMVELAVETSNPVHKGVFVAVAGPNLETAAEYRFLRALGADTVGMSMVPECLAAVHGGMRVLGLNVITDQCLPDALEPAVVADIIETANRTEPRLRALVEGFLRSFDA